MRSLFSDWMDWKKERREAVKCELMLGSSTHANMTVTEVENYFYCCTPAKKQRRINDVTSAAGPGVLQPV